MTSSFTCTISSLQRCDNWSPFSANGVLFPRKKGPGRNIFPLSFAFGLGRISFSFLDLHSCMPDSSLLLLGSSSFGIFGSPDRLPPRQSCYTMEASFWTTVESHPQQAPLGIITLNTARPLVQLLVKLNGEEIPFLIPRPTRPFRLPEATPLFTHTHYLDSLLPGKQLFDPLRLMNHLAFHLDRRFSPFSTFSFLPQLFGSTLVRSFP